MIQSEKEAPSANYILSKMHAMKINQIIRAFRRYKLRKEIRRRAAARRIQRVYKRFKKKMAA